MGTVYCFYCKKCNENRSIYFGRGLREPVLDRLPENEKRIVSEVIRNNPGSTYSIELSRVYFCSQCRCFRNAPWVEVAKDDEVLYRSEECTCELCKKRMEHVPDGSEGEIIFDSQTNSIRPIRCNRCGGLLEYRGRGLWD